LLVSCSPVTTTTIATSSLRLSAFAARLAQLSANATVQRAARYRLVFALSDPIALAASTASSAGTSGSVRSVLMQFVDDVVIVDWLVSFGAMGTWTAYNPDNSETVWIPASTIPSLVQNSPRGSRVYRLRDQKHLMVVHAVVVDNEAVGAVGFILSQTYEDPALEAEAMQLG